MNPGPDQVSSDPRATPKRAPVLACENLERRLGTGAAAVHAVRGVSMDVYPKTSYAILGPSGCGKSTLLSALGLLDHPDGGVVRVDGVEVPVRDERKRAR